MIDLTFLILYVNCIIVIMQQKPINSKYKIRNCSMRVTTNSFIQAHRKVDFNKLCVKTEPTDNLIDNDYVTIVDKQCPNSLRSLLRKRGIKNTNPSVLRTKKNASVFEKVYMKQRTKFINQIQQRQNAKTRLKIKLGLLKPLNISFFDVEKQSLQFLQNKYSFQRTKKGKYNQNMHPLCEIYQEEAVKIENKSWKICNPFQNVYHDQN